jgi:hypothetical protein
VVSGGQDLLSGHNVKVFFASPDVSPWSMWLYFEKKSVRVCRETSGAVRGSHMVTLVEQKIEVRRMMEEVVEKRSKLKGKIIKIGLFA